MSSTLSLLVGEKGWLHMKRMLLFLITMTLVSSLCACGSTDGSPSGTTSVETPPSVAESNAVDEPSQSAESTETNNRETDSGERYTSYQAVLDDYSERIRAAVPGLIEEYNDEAAKNTEGLTGLATISNNKITELAKICNDGISEMAEIMLYIGSGSYEEYEEWAGKLQEVYSEEALKISDAYLASAMG